jgi:HAE1 family hydrophobic/amphiphilic exporter-1
LKQLMLSNRNDLLWSAALVPETAPNEDVKLPALKEAVEQALATRPELKQSALGVDINRLATRLAREQAKPRIDAFANLTATGLAGISVPPGPNPLTDGFTGIVTRLDQLSAAAGLPPVEGISFSGSIPPNLIGSYGQSLSGIYHGNFPTVQVGVEISLPLRNRTALAQAHTSEAEGRRLKAVEEQVAMLIEADVRNSMQTVSSAKSRLDAASLARRSAEEQYSSEQRQFQAGTSTVFLVLQRQSDLIGARSREVRSRADFADAVAMFERATGATVEAHNIKLAEGSK